MDLFSLNGKKILITGGNGGIGLGMAKALIGAGAEVYIWGTNASKNQNAVATLAQLGGKACGFEVNVADKTSVNKAMEQTLAQSGLLDCVIANAAIGTTNSNFLDITDEEYRKVLAVNLDGVVFTWQAAIRQMIKPENQGGSLVVVSSVGGIKAMPTKQHYAASKSAVLAVMTSTAAEYARYNIRANAIVPGFVETEMTEGYINTEPYLKKILPRVPLRTWGRPEDFGGIAVYLASDASRYQTGTTTVIDGGYAVF